MSDDATIGLPGDILQQILDRLIRLEEKVDARAIETRPIWERALAEIGDLRHQLAELRQEMAELRRELFSRFDKLERKFGVLADDFLAIRAEVRDLSNRLDRLEDGTVRTP